MVHFIVIVCASVLACLSLNPAASAEDNLLELKPGDHIAFIGNTLADRMQHSGWLETYLYGLFPEYDLTIRNLGYPGDELKVRPRADNFGEPDLWLTKCKADVVFCFFGYNEALNGDSGLAAFENDLTEVISEMRSCQYNGISSPRLVFFSPIAHENLHSPHLPDGSENNQKLSKYTNVMERVCRNTHTPFVDLFTPSQSLYAHAATPLTMNGIHLLEHGDQAITEVIVRALFPNLPTASAVSRLPNVAKLRAAVLDKSYHWFSRYRVIDEYNVFGGRSELSWNGQSNADVMMREMECFDVMTENRDRKIRAIAKGGDLEVKDDNLPQPLIVETNKKGPLPGGKWPYLGGTEAISKMTVADGLEVNLFASEEQFPRLINPVQMAVDPDSRLWVAVWPSYPHWSPYEPRRDALVILPDENGDGTADDLIVFADELNSVTGFEFWNGGVLVAMPPEILFLKDTDGDDKADLKIRMLQGVSSADTHHSANSVRIGPDGWMYWSRGIFNVANFETPTKTVRSKQSGVHRFNPRTFEYEFHFPIGPNPHGDVFDRWGYQFANDATSGTGSYVNIGKGIGNKHWFEKRVRPVSATGILSSAHFPQKNEGNFLICNTIGFLAVLQHEVHYNGADITAKEIEPILYSSDANFRPSDLEVGGDGALYVSDWHNSLIGHMQHHIRDPNRDHERGRIYRVTAKGRPLSKPAKLIGKPIAEVCEQLFAPDNGARYRARLELSSRNAVDITTQVRSFADRLNPKSALKHRDEAQALLEILWVFEEQRLPDDELVQKCFLAEEPRIRAAAVRTLGHWAGRVTEWESVLMAAARDESPLVRAEAVKTAVEFVGISSLISAEVIFEVATRPTDPELETVLAYGRRSINVDAVVRESLARGHTLSPAAFEYALRYARVPDLLQIERSEKIYRAILNRTSAAPDELETALTELAAATSVAKIDLLMQLIDESRRKNDGNAVGLTQLLTAYAPAELQRFLTEIESIARTGETRDLRQNGYVAWIEAAGPDDAFLTASESKDSLRDFLDAVPLVNESLRSQLFSKVLPLISDLPHNIPAEKNQSELDQSEVDGPGISPGTKKQPIPATNLSVIGGQSVHDLAIRALASIPGFHSEKIESLSKLVAQGKHRPSAIRALNEIPADAWADRQIRPMLDHLMGYLTEMPAGSRTGPAAADAAALARSLSGRLPPDAAAAIENQLNHLDIRIVALGTVSHRMIFDKTKIAVQSGTSVEFRFSNTDDMPHNFAIILPGALEEIGEQAEATARDPDAMARHYVPKSTKVLLASRLLQPGESHALSFDVPHKPGVYPYVCTYPGHWRRMYGALYVVENLEQYQTDPAGYLANAGLLVQDELLTMNARQHEWKFDEFSAEIESLPSGRSWEVGKELFRAANCAGCHRLHGEGNVFGPDLSLLNDRKHTVESIIRSVLEPSREIDEKYQSNIIVLEDGRTMTGMIVHESIAEIHVVINPLAKDKPTVIAKERISEREVSPASLMPTGLLDKLSREEVIDLIAYVYARGDRKHSLFQSDHGHRH